MRGSDSLRSTSGRKRSTSAQPAPTASQKMPSRLLSTRRSTLVSSCRLSSAEGSVRALRSPSAPASSVRASGTSTISTAWPCPGPSDMIQTEFCGPNSPLTSPNCISVDAAGAARTSRRVRPARLVPKTDAIFSLIESRVGI